MTFGEQVKEARKQMQLSQMAFAKKLNVSYSTLNRWENNTFMPNYKAQKRFEEFCAENDISFSKQKEVT